MIRQTIECEWPECEEKAVEADEGAGWPGWGHVRGFRLDGQQRDLHLCPAHLAAVGEFIKGAKNVLDRP